MGVTVYIFAYVHGESHIDGVCKSLLKVRVGMQLEGLGGVLQIYVRHLLRAIRVLRVGMHD